MRILSDSAAILMPGVVRLGGMRLSVFGLCAAVGLIAAFSLIRLTAPIAGIDRDAAVDTGMVAVTTAFVASRVLLIVENWRVFRMYPVLILQLPSLTYGAVATTAVVVTVYLQWKRISLLRTLDAWAPSAAVIAIALSFGHWFEGSDAGMPTRMPWGIADPVLGRVHPVQAYMIAAALAIFLLTLRELKLDHVPGQALRAALIPGGVAAYAIGAVMQPEASVLGLEPRQWMSLAALAVGWTLSMRWLWGAPMMDEQERK